MSDTTSLRERLRELEEARAEQHHRCASCGLRWHGPAGAELCGDCWRATHPGGIPLPPAAWKGTCGHVWLKAQSADCPVCESTRLREQLAAVQARIREIVETWRISATNCRNAIGAVLSALHGAEPGDKKP